MASALTRTASLKINYAEPEHDKVHGEERETQKSCGVAFTRDSDRARAVQQLGAKVLLLHFGSNKHWLRCRVGVLFLSRCTNQCSFPRLRSFLSRGLFFRVSGGFRSHRQSFVRHQVVRRGLNHQIRVFGWSRGIFCWIIADRSRACSSFERVGAWEAGCCGHEIGNCEHYVEDCRANILIQVLVRKRSSKQDDIDENQNFFHAWVFREETLSHWSQVLKCELAVIAQSLQFWEDDAETFVLIVQILPKMAEHQLR